MAQELRRSTVTEMTETPFVVETDAGPIAGHAGGAGAPLLLLHGGPALTDYMDLLSPEVTGWRAIRYQQRCLSPSATEGPFTVERHVADAVAVLDALGVGQAIVAGHSWGGHLALHLAIARPDRVAGLLIIDSLGAVGDGGASELGQELVRRLLPAAVPRYQEVAERMSGSAVSDSDMLAYVTVLWPGYFAQPETAPAIPAGMRTSIAGYAGTFASAAAHLADGSLARELRELRVPAVFLLGAQSPMPVSQGEQTAALLPESEVVIVPAAGHLPWYEQPGCVAGALARIRGQAGDLEPAG
jgi:pimeloyl-ACP methyl ester carboxylesterase